MTVAVTGATGQLGRLVIAGLKDKLDAGDIIALARSPEKAADFGVTAREADYDAPETLAPALAGVDTLLLISGSEIGQRTAQHRAVIEAAKSAGVGHIVYTSLLRADTSPMSLAVEHRETEALIIASGLTYTILRNGWYTENYTGSVPGAVQAGALVGSAGDGRISSAARADYADAAVAVLTAGDHVGQTYELAGDAAYTLSDLAAEVSAQTGKTIPYQNLPQDEYAKVLVSVGLPEGFAGALASFDVDASQGALFHDGKDLSDLIGRPTTPLSKSVSEALA
ncbi:SDR family oxidoreductase [Sulfitobacter pseudonitzschiae]|uniref:SDR family oxidoreductase n=1 Tax=Pseudosulfitobacter pseudonitzschiae TaxID=1402135 RepID=A0A9Q2RT06_9RHOB|nr:SDR family oxidoreductase [Pseudosulfitobacter pseudonitzschiae]MBM2290281.1 SDR family oxidoreductase [Pseudosulfitobacter pseudonitzschiae]MBM2295199.1 SDR family oxidoreductase [Pseudosulfitobacter pseudonitzschiae]MBM2300111.1 SDR family oxidoreductase [Pseudosulfitobacter pseudonitzschiae]MBM2309896.1 SDR family oxidoreductase [Pseudosulfitobacter pseudonitzschiae]MBM2314808.1 SDR family oxidoreductase [Pseudosulfitobacter pseudonitzschiae]